MNPRAWLEWHPVTEGGGTWELRLHHIDGEVIKLAEVRRLGRDVMGRDARIWWKATVPGLAPRFRSLGFASLDDAVDWAERRALGHYGLGAPALRSERVNEVADANARAA